jgi:hypothetical protein
MRATRAWARRTASSSSADTSPDAFDQDDIASVIKGRNSLHGNDQGKVHNERISMADGEARTEGIIESFENMDPKVRAARENASKS